MSVLLGLVVVVGGFVIVGFVVGGGDDGEDHVGDDCDGDDGQFLTFLMSGTSQQNH